jgi:hypothetical protein
MIVAWEPLHLTKSDEKSYGTSQVGKKECYMTPPLPECGGSG